MNKSEKFTALLPSVISYFFPDQAFDIGIGQRYGVLVKRPVPGAARNYSVRASTRTHQTYEGTAMLRYAGTDSKYVSVL